MEDQEKLSLEANAFQCEIVNSTDSPVSDLVRSAHRAYWKALQGRISSHGVNIGQWFFLKVLWAEDGLTQRELSQRVGMMEPTTVTALNAMERQGLVNRVRNVQDRRKVNVFLTDKARGLRKDLLAEAEALNALAIHSLPEADVIATKTVLEAMARSLLKA